MKILIMPILSVYFLLLGLNTTYAQQDSTRIENDTTPIPFVSYWSIGDEFKYLVTKQKKRWKEGVLTKNDSTTYEAMFTVVDSTANSYRIKWIYKTDLSGNFGIPDELIDEFARYERNEVIYTTSEVGDFKEVENWKELADQADSMFTDVINLLGKEDEKLKEQLSASMKPIRDVYSSKIGIEKVVLKELYYFHYPFGIEYTKGDIITYEDQLPNMFGGEPIRGEVKLYVDSVDYENAFCILKQEMDLNKADTKRMMLDLFEKMDLENIELDEFMKSANVSIKDRNSYEYYYYPGVPTRIETLRESLIDINNEKGRNTNQTKIEMIWE